jgi:phosphatidylglycerol:prolipoprotein diacylglycerol transferase
MSPILFVLFGIPVYGYGVMLGISCVAGAHLAVYLSVRSGIPHKKAWGMVLAVIVVGLVGGRIHDLIVNGNLTFDELFKLRHSGRTAYGAFLAATLTGIVAARVFKISFWRFADAAAPTMALGLGLTRIGCFFAGCDYGFQSDSWGVAFPVESPAWRDQFVAGVISKDAAASLPVFPAQLLSSLAGFLLFGLTMWLWFRRPRRAGSVLLLFFGSYGLVRAGLEALREDAGRGMLFGFSTSTTIGFMTCAVALALAFVPPLRNLREDSGEILDWFDEGDEPPAAPAADNNKVTPKPA